MIKEAANIIFVFCQMGSPEISENRKMDCMDYMVNCIIVDNKVQNIDQCKKNFKKGARYEESDKNK